MFILNIIPVGPVQWQRMCSTYEMSLVQARSVLTLAIFTIKVLSCAICLPHPHHVQGWNGNSPTRLAGLTVKFLLQGDIFIRQWNSDELVKDVDYLIIIIFRIPDEWLLENEVTQTKTVSIPTLEPPAMDALKQTLFPQSENSTFQSSTRQKQRRKNVARNSWYSVKN